MSFSGSNAATPSASISFSGEINTYNDTGYVKLTYFFGDFQSPPIFGQESLSGPGSFKTLGPTSDPGTPEFEIRISGRDTFNLDVYTMHTSVEAFGPTLKQALSFDAAELSTSIANVPLPASAPMFGTGLVALGAIGYAARRKKAAA